MDSILLNVVILQIDLIEGDSIIPSGTRGHRITIDYLISSNFSPSDYTELLNEAERAEAEGFLYVDFKTLGKRRRVHPELVL